MAENFLSDIEDDYELSFDPSADLDGIEETYNPEKEYNKLLQNCFDSDFIKKVDGASYGI